MCYAITPESLSTMLPTVTRQYHLSKLDGFHNLRVREVDVGVLRHSEVLVKIHAASLQSRDLRVAKGVYPVPVKDQVVPLSDMAGEIIAVGEDVKKWKVGDRVCANFWLDHVHGEFRLEYLASAPGTSLDGMLTEYRAFPEHSLVHIPDHLSYEEASTLPCAALTAYSALMGQKSLKAGDTVLIQGTGGVAIFGLQIAVSSGATVIIISSSNEKLKICQKLGAHYTINYKSTPMWEKEVSNITKGRGVDHILQLGGGSLMQSTDAVCFGGSIHVIGGVAGGDDFGALPRKIMFKNACLHGVIVGSRVQFEQMNRLISANKVKPVIDRVFPFEEAEHAYEYLAGQSHVGKVVIKIHQD